MTPQTLYDTLSQSSRPSRERLPFLLAGPCVVEGRDITLRIAERLQAVTSHLGIPLVFKASYRKANRSRIDSFTGIGDEAALRVLEEVKHSFDLPIVTDIHETHEVTAVAEVADLLQIPAFLCRQTDLLVAAARTGKIVNIKKGQFLAPASMEFAVDKVRQAGNPLVLLTERGTTFGYGDLVVDMRSFAEMRAFDCPTIIDATHSLQRPNTPAGVTGGQPEYVRTIALAAIAAGADGLFIETHPEPSRALSDGANMLSLDQVAPLLESVVEVFRAVNS